MTDALNDTPGFADAFDEIDAELAARDAIDALSDNPEEDLTWLTFADDQLEVATPNVTNAASRGKPMHRVDFTGKPRSWWSDGEYVYFRPRIANPETVKRHERFMALGHYKHVGTTDDVQVFELLEGSPFKRQGIDLGTIPMVDVRRNAVMAACRYDWETVQDCFDEIAERFNRAFHADFAKLRCMEQYQYTQTLTDLRGGPSENQFIQGLARVRAARGAKPRRMILLPAGRA